MHEQHKFASPRQTYIANGIAPIFVQRNTSSNIPFSIAMLVYRRVYIYKNNVPSLKQINIAPEN